MEKQDLIKKIQEDYLKYAESGNIFDLLMTYENTGIKPELDENLIKSAYVKHVRNGYFGFPYTLIQMQELTGVKPELPKDVNGYVQMMYSLYMHNGGQRLNVLKDAIDVTGIKPFDNIVKDAYVEYKEHGRIEDLNKLKEIIELEPKE